MAAAIGVVRTAAGAAVDWDRAARLGLAGVDVSHRPDDYLLNSCFRRSTHKQNGDHSSGRR